MRQVISATEVFFVVVLIFVASCGASDVDKDTENNLPFDCSGISCRKPPPNNCATDNTLQVFATKVSSGRSLPMKPCSSHH